MYHLTLQKVLQEVAAARSVLMMCGSVVVEGYAFCMGLRSLQLADSASILPMTYLIRGAIFPRRYVMSPSGGSSLVVRPLGELVDMYHDHRATERHDKVYALLGMSSEGPAAAGFSPDYTIPWENLFRRVCQHVFGRLVSVFTWPGAESAVIEAKGYVLGRVSAVRPSDREDRQTVDFDAKDILGRVWPESCVLPASAKAIWAGDIVCSMLGASKPTIIRPQGDCFVVIVAVATAVSDSTDAMLRMAGEKRQSALFSRHRFLLLWDWGLSQSQQQQQQDAELVNCNQEGLQRYFEEERRYHSDDVVKRTWRLVKVLEYVGNYRLREAWRRYLRNPYDEVDEQPPTSSILENVAVLCRTPEQWSKIARLLDRISGAREWSRWPERPDVIRMVRGLATLYRARGDLGRAEKVDVMAYILAQNLSSRQGRENFKKGLVRIVGSFDEEVTALLLRRGAGVMQMTGKVVTAAAKNVKWGEGVMKLLLRGEGQKIQITEALVVAAAGNEGAGKGLIRLLLDETGGRLPVTERVLTAAAGNTRMGEKIVGLLLSERWDCVRVTDRILVAAARNGGSGAGTVKLLLDQKGDQVRITEEVISAAATNGGRGFMNVLLKEKQSEVENLFLSDRQGEEKGLRLDQWGEVESLLVENPWDLEEEEEGRKEGGEEEEEGEEEEGEGEEGNENVTARGRQRSHHRSRRRRDNWGGGRVQDGRREIRKDKPSVVVRNPSDRRYLAMMLQIASGL